MTDLHTLDVATMNGVDANRLWDRVRTQSICFDDFSRDRGELFAARLVSPSTVAFEYKDDGLILVENIVPRLSAEMHFFVWNPRLHESEITAVGRDVCRYVFDTYQLHRLSAFPPAFNKLAVRIATRVGFRFEGMIRQMFLYKGVYQDVEIRGLLADEFRRIS